VGNENWGKLVFRDGFSVPDEGRRLFYRQDIPMGEFPTGTDFHTIWFAPSFILGLGIARLFSDGVTLFRSRHQSRIDWIPLVWALVIFIWQIQYLWAIIELPRYLGKFALIDFLLLLGLSLGLFVSSALILPDVELSRGKNLEDDFLQDGCWALVSLSAWAFLALVVDLVIFGIPIISFYSGLMVCVAVLPLLFLISKKRLLKVLITIVNFAVALLGAWLLSPKFYCLAALIRHDGPPVAPRDPTPPPPSISSSSSPAPSSGPANNRVAPTRFPKCCVSTRPHSFSPEDGHLQC